MEKINSIDYYKEICSTAKKESYNLTNCYFLPDAIREKTECGSLFAEWIDYGLLILDDQEAFYRVYFYLSEGNDPQCIRLNKNAVIELPFRNEMNEKQLLQEQKVVKLGFRLGRKSSMMTAASDQIILSDNELTKERVQYADHADEKQIMELLVVNFNPLYAFLPGKEELSRLIKEKSVFLIRDKNELQAVLISELGKSVATIRQVCVAEKERGKGLGKALVDAYHRHYNNRAISFQHWVDIDNVSAINMYQRVGYRFSLRKANEYIFIREEK